MLTLEKLELIAFDLDNTLCYPGEDFEKVFKRVFGFDLSSVSNKWIEQVTLNQACTGIEAIKSVLSLEKMNEADKYFHNFSNEWAEAQILYPGVIRFLKQLRANFKGKILILTNGPSHFQHSVTRSLDLEKYVDRVYATGDKVLGVRKPSIECFKKLESLSGVSTDKCLFIGDSYEQDHLASLRSGWRSIWIKADKDKKDFDSIKSPESLIQLSSRKAMSCLNLNWLEYANEVTQ